MYNAKVFVRLLKNLIHCFNVSSVKFTHPNQRCLQKDKIEIVKRTCLLVKSVCIYHGKINIKFN